MKKALLLYSSKDGQTQKIIKVIAEHLQGEYQVDLYDLKTVGTIRWRDYDKVLIGAAIRYGHLNKELYQFITQNANELEQTKNAFFCVNLTARKAGKDTPEGSVYMQKFLRRSVWKPQLLAVFAGALFYPRYNWFDRIMIQFIMKITGGETDTSKEVEYTSWEKVTIFAEQFKLL